MPKASKFSPDEGITIYDLKDSEAVHYGDQSKGYVGKNHLKVENTTTTISNVSFTVNSDKSITVNGTNNSGSTISFNLMGDTLYFNDFKGKSFYLSGGTNNASIFMAVRHTDSTPTSMYANRGDANQLIPIPNVIRNVSLSIQVANGTTVSNETVYPMLRLTSIPDSTYEPYLTPNTDLMSYADNAILGAKNPCNYFNSQFATNVVSALSDDGVISIKDVSSAVWSNSYLGYIDIKAGEKYIFSADKQLPYGRLGFSNSSTDFPKTGTTCENYISITANPTQDLEHIYFDGDIIITGLQTARLYIWLCTDRQNASHQTYTLQTMIRLATDTDSTYTPYTMTNKELTDAVPVLPNVHYSYPASTSVSDMILDVINNYKDSNKLKQIGQSLTVSVGINTVGTFVVNMTHASNRIIGCVWNEASNAYIFHYHITNQIFNIKKFTLTDI